MMSPPPHGVDVSVVLKFVLMSVLCWILLSPGVHPQQRTLKRGPSHSSPPP